MTEFLWGASTSPHQIEGNNLNSDWWEREQRFPEMFERSGDALDSYHRYREDIGLLADAGLNAYRFGIEWARIEPEEGQFSKAELAHYRRMIDATLERGMTPVVTLHHFTNPRWFADDGGWRDPRAIDRFCRYVEAAATILADVEWVVTVNEPNVYALMSLMDNTMSEEGRAAMADLSVDDLLRAQAAAIPDTELGDILADAHRAAKVILKSATSARVGWTVAGQAFEPTPGNEDEFARVKDAWEDRYLRVSKGDDFVGVQSYTSQKIDSRGVIPHAPHPDNTLTGWAYRPDALGIALRNAWNVTEGTPILITENGIATNDDARRIAYTSEALEHMFAAQVDGLDVRGYLHWSALDNFEWGHWAPTFGLIAVDRTTFERTPKPSLAWLGDIARSGRA
ncbi:glycoside hydrolase family 1 protein [Herbiconiux sp. A18JL235]|uniref:Glycoside hydrolase family 1 protein n=1 Tax=Herbiconiux sp. A18JL235 TaxID=3152363 RepID=A0AB39BIE9_9MICO